MLPMKSSRHRQDRFHVCFQKCEIGIFQSFKYYNISLWTKGKILWAEGLQVCDQRPPALQDLRVGTHTVPYILVMGEDKLQLDNPT